VGGGGGLVFLERTGRILDMRQETAVLCAQDGLGRPHLVGPNQAVACRQ
jgi:hypothetical protein